MTPPSSAAPPEGDDRPMPLVEHLRELRRRLLVILGCIGATLIVTWTFSDRVVYFITRPVLPYIKQLQFDTLTDPFFSHFKAALYAAIFFNVPVILFETWRFVAPGLYKNERRVSIPFLLLSFPLFVGGALFCYTTVFPAAVSYLVQFDPTLVPSLRIGDYISFTLTLMCIFGLVFEMPLVSLLLTRMGFLTPEFLTRNRRYALLLIFVFAAVVTPTPDAFTQTLLAGPMLVLYEISVVISRLARLRPAGGDSSEDKPRAA